MKKILSVLFALILSFSLFSFGAFAEGSANIETTVVEESSETVSSEIESSEPEKKEDAKDDMDVDLDFNPSGVTRNLKYMGLGMLGIFAVVGVVILITFILNSVTGKKK